MRDGTLLALGVVGAAALAGSLRRRGSPAVTRRLLQLRAFLDLTEAQRGRELARFAPVSFAEWLAGEGESRSGFFGRDAFCPTAKLRSIGRQLDAALERDDDERAEEIMESLPASVYEGYDQPGEYPGWIAGDPTSPSFLHMMYEGLVRDAWLVHFTDAAYEVAHQGFRRGVSDPGMLGLTVHLGESLKTWGAPFNFAFLAEDARRYGSDSYGRLKYGKEAVLFRAGGVKVWHHADQEPQVIFDGAEARDRVHLYRADNEWCAGEDRNGQPVYCADDFGTLVRWVIRNFEQYRRVLAS